MDLVVASSGDGRFADPDLRSVDFVSNWAGFAVPGDNPPPEPDRLWPFFGSVTIVSGKVSSFNGTYYPDIPEDYSLFVEFTGLSASYHDQGGHHTGPTDAVGTLTLVPEPATWLLLLSALSLLAAPRGRSLAGALRTQP